MAQRAEHIRDIMTTGVVNIKQTESVQKAIDIMADRNISCVIIVDQENTNKPVGIITERDLIRRVLRHGKDAKKLKAKDVMTTSLVTISQDATLEEGMRIIEGMKIRRLPVVGAEGVVGLITQSDIVKETYNIHRHNVRLTLHQNIQSYVIVALAIIFLVAFFIKFLR